MKGFEHALMVVLGVSATAWFVLKMTEVWRPMFKKWSPRKRVATVVLALVFAVMAAIKNLTPSPTGGPSGGVNQHQTSPFQNPNSASGAQGSTPAGYPWGNERVAELIAPLEADTNPFYRGLPRVFVETRTVLSTLRTNVTTNPGRVENVITWLSRDGAKERGVVVDTPFAVNGKNSMSIHVPPRVSGSTGLQACAYERGTGLPTCAYGLEHEPYCDDIIPVNAPFEVCPERDPTSRVTRGVSTNQQGQAVFHVR
jgi:hypothetical protein